jgi:hypothetical protein
MSQQEAPPPAIAICPSCTHVVRAQCMRDPGGALHPCELDRAMQLQHKDCDLYKILEVLRRAAFNLSKVRVFTLKGGEEDVQRL